MKRSILILAANPKNTSRLRLDQEVREIDLGLKRARRRDEFELEQVLAARPIDVRRAMLDVKPNIVHFCGHGSGEDGIAFEDETGNQNLVDSEALAGFFELFADTVDCIILNACYSETQAEAIAQHIKYVIGMNKRIGDRAAVEFAVAFYDALGAGESIEFAYKLACNAIQWASLPEDLTPIIHYRAQTTAKPGTAAAAEKYAQNEAVYVNRDEEKKLFLKMLLNQTSVHILLMEAEGGMGKTILSDQFWDISGENKRGRIDFKKSSSSIGDVLRDLVEQFGSQFFSIFEEVCFSVLHELGKNVRQANLIYSTLDVSLAQLSPEDRSSHLKLITDAFFTNLETIRDPNQPVVMLFDTFEKASDSTKQWIAEIFVDLIRRYPRLVCVIAGREVPRVSTDSRDWCLQHKLQPLSDAHSREYILKVTVTQNEELVTYITKLSKGIPLSLMTFVQALLEVRT